MKHDFGISVAVVETMAHPHDQPELHVLPVKWIFDRSFQYTPSYATDLRKTFERIRRQLQAQDRDGSTFGKATGKNVLLLESRKTGLT